MTTNISDLTIPDSALAARLVAKFMLGRPNCVPPQVC
jgi:hypothetical protein